MLFQRHFWMENNNVMTGVIFLCIVNMFSYYH